MGRTVTPKYRMEQTPVSGHHTPSAWNVTEFGRKAHGKPTSENLAKFIAEYHKSLLPGGANDHLGDDARLRSAQIVRQSDDTVMASWTAPTKVALRQNGEKQGPPTILVVKSENEKEWVGWPERWFEGSGSVGEPLTYPKFAWYRV